MRVVFMGTPRFAVPSLEQLAASSDLEVVAVITRPDAASSRGRELRPSPVKERALELGLPVIACASLKDVQIQQTLHELAPDVIVVAAFGLLIPDAVLELPRYCCVNVHPSLLPRWRGAAPIQRSILAGDEQTGVCIMRLEKTLDTGPICSCVKTSVGDKTTEQLGEELAHTGAVSLIAALKALEDGTVVWTAQEEAGLLPAGLSSEGVTYAAKIDKREVRLLPELSAGEALRRVRASDDSAPSRASLCGRSVRVMDAHSVDAQPVDARSVDVAHVPGQGEVGISHGRLLLGCTDGAIEVMRLKPDGKSAMEASRWVNGLHGVPLTWEEVGA